MPIIGIISVPKKRTSFFGMMFDKSNIKEKFGDNPSYIVAEVFADNKEVGRMGKRRLRRLINKAKKLLIDEGAEYVLFSRKFKAAVGEERAEIFEKSEKIPEHRLLDAFLFAYSLSVKGKVIDKIVVRDKLLTLITCKFLEKICTLGRKIIIITDKLSEAECFAEEVYERFGAYIEVVSSRNSGACGCAGLIDVDAGITRVNDFVIDKAEFVSGSGDYQVDAAEEAAFLGNRNMLDIKNWISGKNIIKIS